LSECHKATTARLSARRLLIVVDLNQRELFIRSEFEVGRYRAFKTVVDRNADASVMSKCRPAQAGGSVLTEVVFDRLH
jgi:hypothetical protein